MTSTNHRSHGRPRYQKGCSCPACVNANLTEPCRCSVCVEANRVYARNANRKSKIVQLVPDLVVGQKVAPPAEQLFAQIEVQKELDLMQNAALKAPGLAVTALTMARLLDDPNASPQHPAAASQLRAVLSQIRKAGEGGGASRLQSLRNRSN